ALRYGRDDGVATVAVEAGISTVVLVVEDDGFGVPETLLPRLGERFFRVPGSRRDGSGLGLAIVRQIAERHGATIEFSRTGSGGLRVRIQFAASIDDDH
ncbi:MAG: sensor histidine kinase, partial [Dokdonella sp.]